MGLFVPVWKVELENRIPEKVMSGLQKAFSKAFGLTFEKGAVIIEKTCDKLSFFCVYDIAYPSAGFK